MNITDYLKSEQARADVGKAIETGISVQAGQFPPLRTFEPFVRGAWSVVRFFCADLREHPGTHDGSSIRVYYRADGDRFIVTDLGEAVHAFRLRKGNMQPIYRGAPFWDGRMGMCRDLCQPAELAESICHVLLAAYEVSRL